VTRVKIIDSHTEGEPTRLIVSGTPDLGPGPIARRVEKFGELFEEWFLPVLREPRAYEAMVGAWIGEPTEAGCLRDVIFFNPAGALGMCGHGTMGLMVSLCALEELAPGEHRFNTPAGIVKAKLVEKNRVQIENVPSRRVVADLAVDVPGYGPVKGDVGYGGNWFFLIYEPPLIPGQASLEEMTRYTKAVLKATAEAGYPQIDHVELFGPPQLAGARSKNYVLCPGGEFDRSPCGTGTSAKLACLFAAGHIGSGEKYVQESVIGTSFIGWVEDIGGGEVKPTLEGSAYVTAHSELLFDPADPLRRGIAY